MGLYWVYASTYLRRMYTTCDQMFAITGVESSLLNVSVDEFYSKKITNKLMQQIQVCCLCFSFSFYALTYRNYVYMESV